MSFLVQLADFLIIKHAIRSYQKNMQNEYLRNQAEHEARIAQLKQMEGDHSAEIEDEEFFANHEREMVRIYRG